MNEHIVSHEGSFAGLRLMRNGMPVTGASFDFLAFLERNPQHLQAARGVIADTDLQRLVTRYREGLALPSAA